MKSYSQANQDLFVSVITNKQNGYFLEIGSNDPMYSNNTYHLEKELNWKGLMIEYDTAFESSYKIHRPNSTYIINDARHINYLEALEKNHFPNNLDYLQIDLDVDNKSTLDVLLSLHKNVLNTYKFATITFEHDIYRGNFFDTQNISRKIFEYRGYTLVFPNVSVFWEGSYKPFEDWYVHPDLVDMDLINKIKTTESLTSEQIKEILINAL